MAPVDAGFLLFIYLLITPALLLLSVWFPRQYHLTSKKVMAFVRMPKIAADVLGFIFLLSNVAGALVFIPYGLEGYFWRQTKCPHLFSNTACVKWVDEKCKKEPYRCPPGTSLKGIANEK